MAAAAIAGDLLEERLAVAHVAAEQLEATRETAAGVTVAAAARESIVEAQEAETRAGLAAAVATRVAA
jgi:hypothetical protein